MRVAVIGTSGAGKTTFARRLAARHQLRHIELDAIFHQPGWTELPDLEFLEQVSIETSGGAWVCDGNYGIVRAMVLRRATDVVWLDPPKWVVMTQVTWRSFRRAITRRELWNGNRESFRTWVRPDHPIRWSWSQFARKRREYSRRLSEPEYAHLRVHHFHTRRQARRFIRQS